MQQKERSVLRMAVVILVAAIATSCFVGGLQVPLASVTVTQTGIDRVLVTWDAGASADSFGYEIHASTVAGESLTAFDPVVEVNGATSATVSGLNPGSTYYVSVRATDGGQTSDVTEEKAITLGITWTMVDAPGGTVSYGSPSQFSRVGVTAISATEAYVGYDDASQATVVAVSTTAPETSSYVDKDDADTDIAGLQAFRGISRSGSKVLVAGWPTSLSVRVGLAATPGPTVDWTNVATYSSVNDEVILDDSPGGAHLLRINDGGGSGPFAFYVDAFDGSAFTQLGSAASSDLGGTFPGIPFQIDGNAAAVATGGTTYATVYDFGVYAYDGSTWTDVTGDLPGTTVAADIVTHDGTVYLVGYDSGTLRLHVFEYNGNDASPSWSDLFGGAIGFDTTSGSVSAGNQIAATVVGDSILIAFAENDTNATVRVGRVDLSGSSPAFSIVDGGLAQGLNGTASYNAYALDIGFADGTLFVSWIEETGSFAGGLYTAYAQ